MGGYVAMGSIRSHGQTGCLFFDFRYLGQRCREYTSLPDGVANRKKLQKVLAAIEAEIATGNFSYDRYFPNSKLAQRFSRGAPPVPRVQEEVVLPPRGATTPLFKDFAEVWFSEKEVEWRNSHKAAIRRELSATLIPEFGDKEVGQISKAEVLAYRAKLGKVTARNQRQRSTARINKMMNPLRQILNEAADRFDFRTPFDNIKQLKVKRTDVDPFTLDEVKLILKTVRPDFRAYFTTRFFTGMRTGEIDGLKWKYVDFGKRLIMVRETVVNGQDEYTKTDGSQRDIQMNQLVFDALKEQQKATAGLSDYVFCNRLGTPLDHKNVTSRVWYPLLRHLGGVVRSNRAGRAK